MSRLFEELKLKISQTRAFGLSTTKIMQQHTKEDIELAVSNTVVTHDTFLLSSDIQNICYKQAKEFWEKHSYDPISVQMWTMEDFRERVLL